MEAERTKGRNTCVAGYGNAVVKADNYVVNDIDRAIVALLREDGLTRAAALGKNCISEYHTQAYQSYARKIHV